MKAKSTALLLCGLLAASFLAPRAPALGEIKPFSTQVTAKKLDREKKETSQKEYGEGEVKVESYEYTAKLQSNLSDPVENILIRLYVVGEPMVWDKKEEIPQVLKVLESEGLQLGPQEQQQISLGIHSFESLTSTKSGSQKTTLYRGGFKEYGFVAEVSVGGQLIETLYSMANSSKLQKALETFKKEAPTNPRKKK